MTAAIVCHEIGHRMTECHAAWNPLLAGIIAAVVIGVAILLWRISKI